jgi:NTE family protein
MTDGLAVPISFESRRGSGESRAVVLGGGGIYFVAWQVAYLSAVQHRGLDLAGAQIIIGTSAGSVVATSLAAGHLRTLSREFEALSAVPVIMGALAPADNLHPSQQRALDQFSKADNSRPETVRAIGHAALAAQAASANKMRSSISLLLPFRTWPSPALRVTATDAYTGERVVVGATSGVGVRNAVAASSAVPGLFEPQPIGDRCCMDGGVSGTGVHTDLAAGAERVLVVSLSAHMTAEAGMTHAAGAVDVERAALAASGSKVLEVGPENVDMDTLMDPASARQAMKAGAAAAIRDLPRLTEFWS